MAFVIVGPFTPTDYGEWREFHGRHIDLMKGLGMVADRIYRDALDPARVVVIQQVTDVPRFLEGLSSPEVQAQLANPPIAGEVSFSIVEELEQVF